MILNMKLVGMIDQKICDILHFQTSEYDDAYLDNHACYAVHFGHETLLFYCSYIYYCIDMLHR